MGAIAFAGAGGANNLVQSNYIRDKGLGMGARIPNIVSPITGEEEAAPGLGYTFPTNEENLNRWKKWWRVANQEQFFLFYVVGLLSLIALCSGLLDVGHPEERHRRLDVHQGRGQRAW